MSDKQAKHPLIIGITGASGFIYGYRLLELLNHAGIETHLVVSKAGHQTRNIETNISTQDLKQLATVTYSNQDFTCAIASGSFKTLGMIIAPCSMRTLAEVATGVSTTLISRAADVILKERRRLVLLARETPLHIGHIQAMLTASQAGAIIAPPVPAFYPQPTSLEDIVNHTVGRVLDLFDFDFQTVKRWQGSANTK